MNVREDLRGTPQFRGSGFSTKHAETYAGLIAKFHILRNSAHAVELLRGAGVQVRTSMDGPARTGQISGDMRQSRSRAPSGYSSRQGSARPVNEFATR